MHLLLILLLSQKYSISGYFQDVHTTAWIWQGNVALKLVILGSTCFAAKFANPKSAWDWHCGFASAATQLLRGWNHGRRNRWTDKLFYQNIVSGISFWKTVKELEKCSLSLTLFKPFHTITELVKKYLTSNRLRLFNLCSQRIPIYCTIHLHFFTKIKVYKLTRHVLSIFTIKIGIFCIHKNLWKLMILGHTGRSFWSILLSSMWVYCAVLVWIY